MEILIVLGSPNSPEGELSDISIGRLNECIKQFQYGNKILCTGGWGAHFNTSEKPHAFYGMKYLVNKGLSEKDFLAFALSENTVDDAVKIRAIISDIESPILKVITSDYHLERVKLIFSEILAKWKLIFVGVKSDFDEEAFEKLRLHEQKAIQSILKNGLYY